MTNLLIVESPAKCQKIQGFLGSDWRVIATMGHIRALKEDLEAIGFRGSWDPTYETIDKKQSAVSKLRQAAKAATTIYLGSDDDREGEAIAWHVCKILGLDPTSTPRVIFHEITESALRSAVANPRRIDFHKFNAQQARSMLDMLIGFTLSPCLWRGVGFKPGLSAGRCQTPALRIIYDRDRDIEGHTATNSWRLTATSTDGVTDSLLEWRDPTVYETKAAVQKVLSVLELVTAKTKTPTLMIIDRTERVASSQPPKPFITSSLQQEASSRLGMNPKITMKVAQALYEAGHITYMRTDNPVLSQDAMTAASAVVVDRWGEEYLGSVGSSGEGATTTATATKKVVKKKKAATATDKPEAQAAHEGIRPTHMEVTAITDMTAQDQRLYELIWKRTIQSVMAPELRDHVKLTAAPVTSHSEMIDQLRKDPLVRLTTEWDQTKFAGWRMLDVERKAEEEEAATALFAARQDLRVESELPWQLFKATEVRSTPPSRYTEASLIRELEHRGIGRPSTYATLVETVMDRDYVEKATIPAISQDFGVIELKAGTKAGCKESTRKEKVGGEKDKLRTTALGRTVIEWLLTTFGDMIDYEFTATMEGQLDEVAKGGRPWKSVLTDTWGRYSERYDKIMSAAPASTTTGGGGGGNKAEYGDGYKMVISKKGPLFVLEREGEKTRFASVPAHLSISTATRADAEAAFAAATAAAEGEELGTIDDEPVIRKKGKYGPYVIWKGQNMSCKETDTLEEIRGRLEAKASGDAVDHVVGGYKIKRGPYGLYMFKTGTKGKPNFVSIPDSTDWEHLTVEGAEALYKHSLTASKEKAKKK